MNGYVQMLKTAWKTMGEKARRSFTRYAVAMVVLSAVLYLVLALLRVGVIPLGWVQPGTNEIMIVLGLAFLVPVLITVLALVLAVGTFTAIKKDYFARCYPHETFAEQNHWSKKDAAALYIAVVGCANAPANIIDLVMGVPLGATDAGTVVTTLLWLVLAVCVTPRCIKLLRLNGSPSNGLPAA